MPLDPALRSSSLAFAAALGAAAWIGVAAAAGAAQPAGPASHDAPATAVAGKPAVASWKGRFCTATSCRDTPASPLGAATSFGVAILAIRWLARRPAPGTD